VHQENTNRVLKRVAIIALHVRRVKHHRRAPMHKAIAILLPAQLDSTAMGAIVLIVQQESTNTTNGHYNLIAIIVIQVKHHRRAPRVQVIAILTNVVQERIFRDKVV